MDSEIILLYKRLLFVGVQVIVSLFLISFILSAIKTDSSQVKAAPYYSPTDSSESPNVITSGMTLAMNQVNRISGSTINSINNGITSVASAMADSGGFVVHNVASGLSAMGRITAGGITSALNVPGEVIGSAVNSGVIENVIRPDHNLEVPIIDPNSPELLAAIASLPPADVTQSEINTAGAGPVWPIQGRITAEFGTYHSPYQRVHTGLDISNGQASGTTSIRPFRPGKVIDTIHSKYGLGNHVIVDHGNGVTSVYAHLSSISARVGQEVGLDTQLGLVGSTGLSTGPHLHFEIRVNGKAANPKQFISGQPS